VDSLEEKLQHNPKALLGNKGYRRYLKLSRGELRLDPDKVAADERFDGKWVLRTNTDLSVEKVALKYKELWRVEQVLEVKSVLETRPVYHQRDETIRGHVFCSFLALVLMKELDWDLEEVTYNFEWANIKQDLQALQVVIEEIFGHSKRLFGNLRKGLSGGGSSLAANSARIMNNDKEQKVWCQRI
jgi:transposase